MISHRSRIAAMVVTLAALAWVGAAGILATAQVVPGQPGAWVDRTTEMQKAQADALADLKKKGLDPPEGMVLIPAGEFTMGSPDGEGNADEHPQHKVMLSAYWIDQTEVTKEQYGRFLEWIKKTGDHSKCFKGEPANKDHTPYWWTDPKWNGAKQPVVLVDWYDAYAYAAWAGKRLPTEAEWEKAARGTDGREYPWGNEWDSGKCNSRESYKYVTVASGSYPEGKSPYGCLDIAGNVGEWCADWYSDSYFRSSPGDNPTGPATGTSKLLRGGSWDYYKGNCHSALRDHGIPVYRGNDIGFRCARDY